MRCLSVARFTLNHITSSNYVISHYKPFYHSLNCTSLQFLRQLNHQKLSFFKFKLQFTHRLMLLDDFLLSRHFKNILVLLPLRNLMINLNAVTKHDFASLHSRSKLKIVVNIGRYWSEPELGFLTCLYRCVLAK